MTHHTSEVDTKKLWFKRKRYGWGWTPCTWQGWGSVVLYTLLVLFFIMRLEPEATTKEVVIGFILPLSVITLLFIELAYKKGEKPRWQWGNRTWGQRQ